MRTDEQPPHREPMILRHLPQGDGNVTAQARLRGQQIIKTGVEPALGDIESGGEQIPRDVEQKFKIHCGEFVALLRQDFEREQSLTGVFGSFTQAAREIIGAISQRIGRLI